MYRKRINLGMENTKTRWIEMGVNPDTLRNISSKNILKSPFGGSKWASIQTFLELYQKDKNEINTFI